MNERVLLIDVDSHNFPNLVLMKLSAYHKAEGDKVNFIKLTPEDKKLILTGQPMWFDGEYDRIYAACVFTENEKVALNLKNMGACVGGTGILNFAPDEYYFKYYLPEEIEHIYPDYELYGDEFKDTAYGFLTRGCPRECPFCIVSRKEGNRAYKVADLWEFYEDQNVIKLLDPNILACKDHMVLLQQLVDSGAWVDFTQKEAKEYEQSLDKLYKPLNYDKHYADTAHQPIEVMQANMTRDEFVGFLKGNIIKYACRLGKKDEPEKEAAKIRRYAEWLEQAVNGQTIDPRK